MSGKIIHQQQPHDMGCAHTCIAMVLGIPALEVVEKIKTMDGGMSSKDIQIALTFCRVPWNAFVYSDLVCPGVYLASVPSLNNEAGAHCVVLEVADDWTVSVHDPQRGRAGKKYYAKNPEPGAVPLKSWSEVVYVVAGHQDARLPKETMQL